MKKPTLTIGLAAYNEGHTIGHLLDDLINQVSTKYILEKIIIISDGSTDNTVRAIKKSEFRQITLIRHKTRHGLGPCLNQIFRLASSDILITLDADIRMTDQKCVERLIAPIATGQADYTTSSIIESQTDSFFAHCIILSMQVKREIYRALKSGNNIYTSFGLARAYAYPLYHGLSLPTSIGNDMYTYLFTKSQDYRFAHVPTAVVRYDIPKNLTDYSLQSVRFFQAKETMKSQFGDQVSREFQIPLSAYTKSLVQTTRLIARSPIHALAYALFLLYSYTSSLIKDGKDTWEIASSTKQGGERV